MALFHAKLADREGLRFPVGFDGLWACSPQIPSSLVCPGSIGLFFLGANFCDRRLLGYRAPPSLDNAQGIPPRCWVVRRECESSILPSLPVWRGRALASLPFEGTPDHWTGFPSAFPGGPSPVALSMGRPSPTSFRVGFLFPSEPGVLQNASDDILGDVVNNLWLPEVFQEHHGVASLPAFFVQPHGREQGFNPRA